MNTTLKEKYQQFKEWQKTPFQVAPLSDAEHDCPTCGTHYQGNFCPRCGQSAKIGRYSFKKAFLLFLDVWGLGNRSMFRSLRDLLLRPGYMIRDYLNGMQMAYFPPFKMLFLLTTLGVLVAHGLNVQGISQQERQRQEVINMQLSPDAPQAQEDKDKADLVNKTVNTVFDWQERFPNILSLLFIIFLSSFYYIFFRKAKTIEGIRYSEFFIVMVYTANMLSIYEVLITFFCLPSTWAAWTSLLSAVPLKQLSGFSWKRTILSMLGALILMLLLIFTLSVVGVIIGLIFFPEYFPNVAPQGAA